LPSILIGFPSLVLEKTNPDGTITFTFPDPDYRTFFFKVKEK